MYDKTTKKYLTSKMQQQQQFHETRNNMNFINTYSRTVKTSL